MLRFNEFLLDSSYELDGVDEDYELAKQIVESYFRNYKEEECMKEVSMDGKSEMEFINEWHRVNGHLLEEEVVLLQEDQEFREASAAIKGAVYGVFDNAGSRKGSGIKSEDMESEIVESNMSMGKSEWIMSKYVDEKGKEVITYDDGGVVGRIVNRMNAEINYGRANETAHNGRHDLVDHGYAAGVVVIRDDRGNYIRKGSLNDEVAYKAKEDAMTRRLVKDLEARSEKRTARKELALKVMDELIAAIKDCENYGRIKRIIGVSHYVLRRRLKAEFGNGFVTDYCRYYKDGKETNLNSWFLSYFTKKLWAAVNVSKWKLNTMSAYDTVQKKLDAKKDICDNMYHMADLLRSNPGMFGIAPKEARIALNYAKANKGTVRGFSKPVFFALCEVAKAA